MIAVARLLEYGVSAELTDVDAVANRFRDDRAWLDRLAGHYLDLPMRGSQLDPAAWFVMLELDQHLMAPGLAVSPLGPEDRNLMRQLFDRSDERLSAAILPELLQRFEIHSIELWRSLLEAVLFNQALLAVVSSLNADWFDAWMDVQPPAAVSQEGTSDVVDDALIALADRRGSLEIAGIPGFADVVLALLGLPLLGHTRLRPDYPIPRALGGGFYWSRPGPAPSSPQAPRGPPRERDR